MMYETLNDAGYKHVLYTGNKQHILKDKSNGNLEVWFSNKNHASYGLIYKNTHLEFAYGLHQSVFEIHCSYCAYTFNWLFTPSNDFESMDEIIKYDYEELCPRCNCPVRINESVSYDDL